MSVKVKFWNFIYSFFIVLLIICMLLYSYMALGLYMTYRGIRGGIPGILTHIILFIPGVYSLLLALWLLRPNSFFKKSVPFIFSMQVLLFFVYFITLNKIEEFFSSTLLLFLATSVISWFMVYLAYVLKRKKEDSKQAEQLKIPGNLHLFNEDKNIENQEFVSQKNFQSDMNRINTKMLEDLVKKTPKQ